MYKRVTEIMEYFDYNFSKILRTDYNTSEIYELIKLWSILTIILQKYYELIKLQSIVLQKYYEFIKLQSILIVVL
jgi:hypothetical protein